VRGRRFHSHDRKPQGRAGGHLRRAGARPSAAAAARGSARRCGAGRRPRSRTSAPCSRWCAPLRGRATPVSRAMACRVRTGGRPANPGTARPAHCPGGLPPDDARAPSSASSRQRSSARVAANMTAASNAGSLSGSRRSSTTVVSTSRLALREASLPRARPRVASVRGTATGDRRLAPLGPALAGVADRRGSGRRAAPGARGRGRWRAPRGVEQDLVHAAHARADRLQRQRQRLIHQPLQAVLGRDQVRLEAVGLPDHLRGCRLSY